ncbi:unnamed protein product, partial [Larinioides sclopetarius]
ALPPATAIPADCELSAATDAFPAATAKGPKQAAAAKRFGEDEELHLVPLHLAVLQGAERGRPSDRHRRRHDRLRLLRRHLRRPGAARRGHQHHRSRGQRAPQAAHPQPHVRGARVHGTGGHDDSGRLRPHRRP